MRFLIAREGDIDAAEEMLMACLKWRESSPLYDAVGSIATCSSCVTDPHSHCFRHVGTDRLGRGVIYSCPARAANTSPHDGAWHIVYTLERMLPPTGMGKINWLVDVRCFRPARDRVAPHADHSAAALVLLPTPVQRIWLETL